MDESHFVLLDALFGQGLGVHMVRELQPDEHAAFGFHELAAFGEVFADAGHQSVVTLGVDGGDLLQMAFHQAAVEELGHDGLRQGGGMGVAALLDDFQLLGDLHRGHAGAHADAGGQGLGEGVHHDDLVGLVEQLDGRDLFAAETDVAVGVVFQHDEVVLGGQLGDALTPVGGDGDAGGVLEGGDGVEHLGMQLFGLLFQLFHDEAVVVGGDGDQLYAALVQHVQGAQEGGAFHEDHVAFVQQDLAGQVDALAGTGEADDVVQGGLDALGLHDPLQIGFAQGLIARGQAVDQHIDGLFVDDVLGDVADLFQRETFLGGRTAAQRDDLGIHALFEQGADGAGTGALGTLGEFDCH